MESRRWLIRLEETSVGASVPDLVVLAAMRQRNVPVVITSPLISPRDRARKIEEFFRVAAAVKQVLPGGYQEKQMTNTLRPLLSRRVGRFQTGPNR